MNYVFYYDSNDVYFDNLSEIIISELDKAKKSVKIAVAWINFEVYYEVFKRLLKRDIKLKIILSDNSSNRKHYSKIQKLTEKGAKVYFIKMPNFFNHMHHKFCIIDNRTILNGSYNWTKNADKNFENLFILRDSPLVVEKLKSEFKTLMEMSEEIIKKLQNLKKCDSCREEVINLLIIVPQNDKYCTTETYLIQLCSANPYDHYQIINEDILTDNTSLEILSLFDEYDEYDIVQEYYGSGSGYDPIEIKDIFYKNLDFKLSELFNVRTNRNTEEIHAVGLLFSEIDYYGDVDRFIKVYWKEKFVASLIPDKYHDTFGVV